MFNDKILPIKLYFSSFNLSVVFKNIFLIKPKFFVVNYIFKFQNLFSGALYEELKSINVL
jgi:hypothetical protein